MVYCYTVMNLSKGTGRRKDIKMNKKIYIVTILIAIAFFTTIFSKNTNAAPTDYRLEYGSCIFSYVFPNIPSVKPIWRPNSKEHSKFLRQVPLNNKILMQGINAIYKYTNFKTLDMISIDTYCLNLDKKLETGDKITAQDMLNILKIAINSMDTKKVKSVLSQEEIRFNVRKNGISHMSLRGTVQDIVNNKTTTIVHYREVFAYKNQILLIMASYIDSKGVNEYQKAIDTLLESLILAE